MVGGINQQWRFQPNHDGSFRLVSVKSGKVLDSPGGSTTKGQVLDQWTDNSAAHQWWKVVPTSGGYCRLVNVKRGLCADAENGATADGTRIIQWSTDGGSNQEWQIVAV
ncbi:RICIN domain-containing protein [Streptomyces sp. Ag82_O1-15]|uniref:RICIN domain-containing protein n=1 Tax=Streptomyces sp. Ag82_O1-15 TaxID=1938855 RepID=UPI00211CF03A|nr:RICIN domain-containing protein [Streptomyces sp. Ag82_O1-15]